MFVINNNKTFLTHKKKDGLSPLRLANQDIITKEVFENVSSNSSIVGIQEQTPKESNLKETTLV